MVLDLRCGGGRDCPGRGWGLSPCANASARSAERCRSNRAWATELKFPFDFHWEVTMPTRIILADDHVLVRQGLRSLLEREKFQVMAEASDGQDAVRLIETNHPDIAILDISMPTLNGIDAARSLSRSSPKTKIILLTQHEEEQYIHEALEAGVKGDVLKNQAANDFLQAFRQDVQAESYLAPGISRAAMEA